MDMLMGDNTLGDLDIAAGMLKDLKFAVISLDWAVNLNSYSPRHTYVN